MFSDCYLVVATQLTEHPVYLGTWMFFELSNPVLLKTVFISSFTFTQKLKDEIE